MAPDIHTLPEGDGLLYNTDGSVRVVQGPYTRERLCELLECEVFQYIPFTVGPLAGQRELWCDEEGLFRSEVNSTATSLYGEQVLGELHGLVLIKHAER